MWAHMIKSYPVAFPPAVTNEVNKLDPQILEATAKHRTQEKLKWFIECIDFSLLRIALVYKISPRLIWARM